MVVPGPRPPATRMLAPDVQDASGDRRYDTAPAISSGLPRRPSGMSASDFARFSGSPVMAATMSVSVTPGETALMRMPLAARGLMRPCCMLLSAPFDMAYSSGVPMYADPLERLTMAAPAAMRFAASRQQIIGPRTFVAIISSKAGVATASRPSLLPMMPALFTSAVSGGRSDASSRSKRFTTAASLETSARIACARPPAATMLFTTSAASFSFDR
mmetsp:Transcript_12119/g.37314  ORF Transcript_12119/g.37314 Transcript_12119/m.37314 type:complete len:216 (-) Transcript_12119:926-1573(-)